MKSQLPPVANFSRRWNLNGAVENEHYFYIRVTAIKKYLVFKLKARMRTASVLAHSIHSKTTTRPPVIFSQPWSPQPSTIFITPQFCTSVVNEINSSMLRQVKSKEEGEKGRMIEKKRRGKFFLFVVVFFGGGGASGRERCNRRQDNKGRRQINVNGIEKKKESQDWFDH